MTTRVNNKGETVSQGPSTTVEFALAIVELEQSKLHDVLQLAEAPDSLNNVDGPPEWRRKEMERYLAMAQMNAELAYTAVVAAHEILKGQGLQVEAPQGAA